MESEQKRKRSSLDSFTCSKVLRHDNWGRATSMLGKFTKDSEGKDLDVPVEAIVILQQNPFDVDSVCSSNVVQEARAKEGEGEEEQEGELTLLSMLQQPNSLELTKTNDVYSYFKMVGVSASDEQSRAIAAMTKIRVEIIEPASWLNKSKYLEKQIVTITETPELYEKCTLPYLASIEKKEAKRCKWVYNILDGIAEQDSVLCQEEDVENGYVAVRSPNWKDDLHANAFYLCLVRNHNLKSLRDLNASHLPLLKGLRDGCLAAMEEKHGLASVNVHVYFHYQPSFFHLHVHFRAIGASADPNLVTAREYPLSDVIDNIEICSDYYTRRTLTFASIDHEALTEAFARENKSKFDAPLLIVLDYERLHSHFIADDKHVKVFLEFVFNHFHVALIAADPQKENARENMGEIMFEQLQWCDSELTGHRTDGFGGIIAIDVPASSISDELNEKPNIGIVSLPVHIPSLHSAVVVASTAFDQSVFAHGEKLRKLLWACRHANAANIRSFIAIRDTYGSGTPTSAKEKDV